MPPFWVLPSTPHDIRQYPEGVAAGEAPFWALPSVPDDTRQYPERVGDGAAGARSSC